MALKRRAVAQSIFNYFYSFIVDYSLVWFYQQLNSFPAKVLTPEIATVDSKPPIIKGERITSNYALSSPRPTRRLTVKFISQRDLLANKTVSLARQAVQVAPNDYRSWELYGDVASLFIQAKVPNAITEAKNAYERALALNPNEPKLEVKFAETLLQLRSAKLLGK